MLDQNACRVLGIAAQAAYNEKQAKVIGDARTAYIGARARYVSARRAAEPKVGKAGKDLGDLIEKIRCQLDADDLERLDQAFDDVVRRLDRCGSGLGCDCADEEDDDEIAELGRRAALERRTAEAAACFHRLISEPGTETPQPDPATPVASPSPPVVGIETAAPPAAVAPAEADGDEQSPQEDDVLSLPQRVTNLQKEIDEIAAELAGGADPVDLYASAIVARRGLKTIWLGFDNVNDYMDRLCDCLTAVIDGHAKISVLVRRAAVEDCYRKSWREACRRLERDAAAEVVAKYLRICADDDDHDEDGYEPPGEADDDDRGHRGRRGGRGRDRRRERDDDDDDDVEINIDVNVDADDDDEPPRPVRPRRGTRAAREPEPGPEPEAAAPSRKGGRRPRRAYSDETGGYRAP
ncbi:hypothetical protein FXF51_20370 [Nonomuraea sp. PA05]|uniref:hypothetical protein n=1 Tax=Nonomuraea sp. PA05 TaxID=2604466 RepID=UPI0011D506D3|nr:hypothetical protein [Nonomuraea sp. PA05]TYB64810.1 hypothetical protein FXF51_20370 [Nonomuraea sp. PA05]